MQPDDDDTLACLLPSIYHETMVTKHIIEKPKEQKHRKLNETKIQVGAKKKNSKRVVFDVCRTGGRKENKSRYGKGKRFSL